MLMHLTAGGVVEARWSDIIQEERTRNLLADRSDLTTERLEHNQHLVDADVPDARI